MDVDALLARVLRQSAVLLVADERGVVIYASERSAEVIGEVLVGQELGALLAGEDGVMDDLWPTLRAGGTWTGAIARKDRRGRLAWLRGAVFPVRDEAGEQRFVATATPISGPAHVEGDLRDAADLYENAPYALHSLDEGGRIIRVNSTWLAWMGYAREEVEGAIFFKDVITRESYATFLTHFSSFKERGFVRDLEFSFRRKDGSTFPGLLSATAIKDGSGRFLRSRSVILDLSARKSAEAAAALLHERLVSAIEAVQDPFAIYDAEDKLVLCNSACRRTMLEPLRGAVLGRRYEEILDGLLDTDVIELDGETKASWKARRLAYRRSPVGSFEKRMRDGRVYRTFERRTPEGGTVSVAWDMTEVARREAELSEAQRAADAANKAKSEFLSSMSHELRTPLNAILGFAQLLGRDKSPPLTARQLGYLKHVLRGGEHLLRLIDEVLDLARIESGHVPISVEPVDVEAVLREVSVTLDPMAQSRGVSLALMPLPADLPQIRVDRTRFSQILLNYGSNAIKYNRAAGQVSFVASVTPSADVRVTVADTGIGIPAERSAELFQPFHRLGQEAGSIEGTGIGLAIVKRLAELMGGRVGVHSTPGKGSEFWVEFPALVVALEERVSIAPRTPPRSEPFAGAEGRMSRMLYIEDNPANLALMQELIATLETFELLTAPTAEIGIELARAHKPDIVVLDINLPGMSGFEAIEHLKRSSETREIPVVALSASAMERDVRRAEQAGFSRYLTKPVKIEELCDALDALVSRA